MANGSISWTLILLLWYSLILSPNLELGVDNGHCLCSGSPLQTSLLQFMSKTAQVKKPRRSLPVECMSGIVENPQEILWNMRSC